MSRRSLRVSINFNTQLAVLVTGTLLASAIAAGAPLSSAAVRGGRAKRSRACMPHRVQSARCSRRAPGRAGLRTRSERRSSPARRRHRPPARRGRGAEPAPQPRDGAAGMPGVGLVEQLPHPQTPASAVDGEAKGFAGPEGLGGEPPGGGPPAEEVRGEEEAPREEPSPEEVPVEETPGGEALTPSAPQFAPDSVWNAPLSDLPLYVDPESTTLVHALASVVEEELARKVGPWVTRTSFSTPIYSVPADQPTVRVLLDNNNAPLQRAFDAVPLPVGAQPASGSDAQLTVWQPGADRLWEFWHMDLIDGQWHAGWGGAIEGVSQSTGYFSAESWPGARSNWGATATSLPLAGGLITLEDLERGTIDHALALGYPLTESRVFRFPAQRTDGRSESPYALPEGLRLRIDPTLDLSSLHLPPFTLMIARAAQRYGIVLRDTSGVVDFFGQDPTPTGGEPFAPWLEGKKPWQLLAQFPWDRLQVLSASHCTGQPCPESLGE